jgi:hypothetical protein
LAIANTCEQRLMRTQSQTHRINSTLKKNKKTEKLLREIAESY